ncbi:hypothetical protein PV341_17895 [Streptomyces sp. PA03-1a]|nr:hypothetical protein [Streptomyces sp. PA03-1a]MDX2819127.1 hypothetical protein [Streptomyces sp. PA03-5A]
MHQQQNGGKDGHHELYQDPVMPEQTQALPHDWTSPVSSDAMTSNTFTAAYRPR